jgi:thymidine kinase
MFAGKTTALIKAATDHPTEAIVVKTRVDVRYTNLSELRTHDGRSQGCCMLTDLTEVLSLPEYHAATHIFVDEGQFFPDLVSVVLRMAEGDGKHVTVAALFSDYKRTPFKEVAALAAVSDEVQFLSAKCAVCDKEAKFTWKKAESSHHTPAGSRRLDVGGNEMYEPLCREHYTLKNRKKNLT